MNIPKDYLDKLNAMGVTDQFKANCKDGKFRTGTFHQMICSAFYWPETPEGIKFWMNVALEEHKL